METQNCLTGRRVPWNKRKLTGQKPPLKLPEIWAIRTRLQMSSNVRELAMFNLAIDSKLRACDLTRLRVQDVCRGSYVGSRSTVMQQKTQRPVQFENSNVSYNARRGHFDIAQFSCRDFFIVAGSRTMVTAHGA
jgi:hypothetical protein